MGKRQQGHNAGIELKIIATDGVSHRVVTKENTADKPDMNTPEAQEAGEQEEYCENCGKVMVLRRGPFGHVHELPGLQRGSALQDDSAS